MPKIKTNKGAAKRFKITGTGKVSRKKAGLRHLLTNKQQGTKRGLRKSVIVGKTHEDSIKKLIPYN